MRVGVVQICSSADAWANLALVSAFIQEAESAGCDLICFPENLFYRGPRSQLDFGTVLEIQDQKIKITHDFSRELAAVLNETKLAVSFGSVLEKSNDANRPYNSHWLIGFDKTIVSYKKIHLFSFKGTDGRYEESEDVTEGKSIESVRVLDFNLGLSICYDLRFPELYRQLSIDRQTTVLLVPAAFTLETGAAHWHTLLRARAVENLSFVIAAAQWGGHQNNEGKSMSCYGHALVYDPWGQLLAEGPEKGEALLVVNLEREEVNRRRNQLPVFNSVRPII
ncbi:MAG: nitrilase-like protein 2 [Bacteriovoracaceae bacterium]|nr:nitrilase-like protein 2 [Bacteriovoracaceae bacterium]